MTVFLFFFPPPPFFISFSFSLPFLLGCSVRSSVSGGSSPSLADTSTSPVRPVHGKRWLWSHPWMGVGNTATLGRRLGRWFHLAAPLISLLELVEIFYVISLSFSTLTPDSKKNQTQTCFLSGFFVRNRYKKFLKKTIPFLFLVSSPSLSFSSEKEELLEKR